MRSVEDMQRQLERQTNELICSIHVLETVLSILLKDLFLATPQGGERLAIMKSEAIATIQSAKAISGDPQDSMRIQAMHSMIAEGVFARIEEVLTRTG